MADAILVGGGGGGVHSDDVTASKAQILEGYTDVASDSGDEVVYGTMPNRGTVNYSLPINGSFTIAQGCHSGSGKVSQSIATKGAATYYPSTSDQTIASEQYLSGAQTIKGISQQNLIASNIKKGVTVYIKNGNNGNIYAVTGTWEGYVPTANQPFNRGAWGSGWSIVGQNPTSGHSSSSVTVTYPGSSIHLVPNGSSGGYYGGALLYLKLTSMNNISTINISFSGNIGTYNASDNQYHRKEVMLGIWNSVMAQFSFDNATAYTVYAATVTASEATLSLNVSSITTDQYIAFGAVVMANATSYLDITRIWFT